MEKEGAKEIDLPFGENAMMQVNKKDNDVYSGAIVEQGKITHKFELENIPQLAAHLLSHFELYDEAFEERDQAREHSKEESHAEQSKEESKEESKPEPVDDLKSQVKELQAKVDSLLLLVASNKDPIEKSEDRTAGLKKINAIKDKLKKSGLMPKMPKPPSPGTKVGGNNGLTQGGIHGDKTSSTDTSTKTSTGPKTNDSKIKAAPAAGPAIAKLPKAIKSEQKKSHLVLKKNEVSRPCYDCGQKLPNCACFQTLSAPKRLELGTNILLQFESDWDKDSVNALLASVKRGE